MEQSDEEHRVWFCKNQTLPPIECPWASHLSVDHRVSPQWVVVVGPLPIFSGLKPLTLGLFSSEKFPGPSILG